MWTDGSEMKLEGLAEKLGWQGKTIEGGGMAVEGGKEAFKRFVATLRWLQCRRDWAWLDKLHVSIELRDSGPSNR